MSDVVVTVEARRRRAERSLRSKLAIAGLVVLLLGLAHNAVFRAGFDPRSSTDMSVYRLAAIAALHHEPIYEVRNARGWPYVYPPSFAVLSFPLAAVSLPVGALCFYFFSLACVGGVLALARASLPDAPWRGSVVKWAAALTSLFFIDVFTRGQIDHLILLALVVCLHAWLERRAWLAGIALGFALAIKPTPGALLLLFFLVRGEWRFLAWSLAGFALWMLAPAGLFFGPDVTREYLSTWVGGVVRASGGAGSASPAFAPAPDGFAGLADPALRNNQSLHAFWTRSGAAGPLGRWLALASVLALLVLSVRAWRVEHTTRAKRIVQFASPILVTLVAAPLARDDYFVALFPAMLGLLAMRATAAEPERRVLTRALGVASLALLPPLVFPDLRYASPLLIGTLVIWAASIGALRRPVGTMPDR